MGVAADWQRVEQWLSSHAPDWLLYLPPGASGSAIAEAEARLGGALPDDFREFLGVHDGAGGLWLHDLGVPLSLAEALKHWDMEAGLWGGGCNDEWATPAGPIRKKWFSTGWVPFLGTWCGDYTCVDLDPPEDGRRGQLISWYHNIGPTEVVAPSIAELVHRWADELDAGLYRPCLDQQGKLYLERDAE